MPAYALPLLTRITSRYIFTSLPRQFREVEEIMQFVKHTIDTIVCCNGECMCYIYCIHAEGPGYHELLYNSLWKFLILYKPKLQTFFLKTLLFHATMGTLTDRPSLHIDLAKRGTWCNITWEHFRNINELALLVFYLEIVICQICTSSVDFGPRKYIHERAMLAPWSVIHTHLHQNVLHFLQTCDASVCNSFWSKSGLAKTGVVSKSSFKLSKASFWSGSHTSRISFWVGLAWGAAFYAYLGANFLKNPAAPWNLDTPFWFFWGTAV